MSEQKQTTDRYTVGDLEVERDRARCQSADSPRRAGDPVAHSLSPQMQNAALEACQMGTQYARFHPR
jgi:hypothetical protein